MLQSLVCALSLASVALTADLPVVDLGYALHRARLNVYFLRTPPSLEHKTVTEKVYINIVFRRRQEITTLLKTSVSPTRLLIRIVSSRLFLCPVSIVQ